MAAEENDNQLEMFETDYTFTGQEIPLMETLKGFILRNITNTKKSTGTLLFRNGDTRGMVKLTYYPALSGFTHFSATRGIKTLVINEVFITPRRGGHLNQACDELLADPDLANYLGAIVIESVLSEGYRNSLTRNGWREDVGENSNFVKKKTTGGSLRKRKYTVKRRSNRTKYRNSKKNMR